MCYHCPNNFTLSWSRNVTNHFVRIVILLLGFSLFPPNVFATFSQCKKLIASFISEPRGKVPESTLRKIEARFGDKSLLDIQEKMSKKSIQKHNSEILTALQEPLPGIETKLVTAINESQANRLYRSEAKNPIVGGQENYEKYDPEGCIGFCFGRATVVHIEGLRRKIHPEAIRKIWSVGPTKFGGESSDVWDYHVATIFKAKGEEKWWVADSNNESSISIDQWIKGEFSTSTDGRLMLFVTDARRFSVFSSQLYSPTDLLNNGKVSEDFYNSYFRDYLEYVAKSPPPAPFKP